MKDKIDILSDKLNRLLNMPASPNIQRKIHATLMELELARQEKATTIPLKHEI